MQTLRLGVATVDITPTMPVPLAGFGSRFGEGPSQGVSQPLSVCVFMFEQDGVEGEVQRALVITGDLLWWGPDQIARLFPEFQRRWGIAPEMVVMNASHTHSGPQTSTRYTHIIGSPNLEYIAILEQQVLEATERASHYLEPVTIERGSGECTIGIYRRLDADEAGGLLSDDPDPFGPRDTEVTAIRFRRADGSPKALWVHYACHPVITEDNLVSAEFPGVAMRLLEQDEDGMVAAFLQGCCADINPDLGDGVVRRRGHDEDIRRLGGQLAAAVQEVLQRPMQPLQPTPLRGTTMTLALPFQTLPVLDDLRTTVDAPDILGEWSRLMLAEPERIQPTIPFHMSRLDLAVGLSLLAMDAEVTVEYGRMVKTRSGGQVLPVPYSNGMIGYVATARQIQAGGYEAIDSCPYFGLPGPLQSSIEQQIHAAFHDLIEVPSN